MNAPSWNYPFMHALKKKTSFQHDRDPIPSKKFCFTLLIFSLPHKDTTQKISANPGLLDVTDDTYMYASILFFFVHEKQYLETCKINPFKMRYIQ